MPTPVTRYRIQRDPMHGALFASGVALTGLVFALFAPNATNIMLAVMCVCVYAWAVYSHRRRSRWAAMGSR
jgi:hypothetical protein